MPCPRPVVTFWLAIPAVGLALASSGVSIRAQASLNPDPRTVATFSGRLTSVSPREPLDGMRLGLTHLDRSVAYETATDAIGGFEFAKIRPGQYYVVVLRDGDTYPLGRVALRAGQSLVSALTKGVEMAGIVTNERGVPVAGITVCALRRESLTGPPRFRPRMWVETDAKGRFVLGPGVQAEDGVYIAAVMPTGCDMRVRQVSDRLAAYPPLYAPGVHAVADASELVLDARSSPRVSFQLKPGATTRVEGRLMGYVNTTVVPGQVIVEPPDGPAFFLRTAPIAADGRFAIFGLTHGSYRLRVAPKRGPDPLKWAEQSVTLAGEPVRRLVIPMHPAMALAGEIRFAGHLSMLYGTRVFLTVSATRVGERPGMSELWPIAFSSVLPDGKFGITGLAPGQYRLSVEGAEPRGWHTKSALYAGPPGEGERLAPIDLFDAPITIEPGKSVFGLPIEMTDLSTTTTGRVLDAEGQPVGGAPVVIFSADPRYWTFGWRRTRVVLADRSGAFKAVGLPEGDYLAAAWPAAAPRPDPRLVQSPAGQRPDPLFFATIRAQAIAFSLPDGGTRDLEIRLTGK